MKAADGGKPLSWLDFENSPQMRATIRKHAPFLAPYSSTELEEIALCIVLWLNARLAKKDKDARDGLHMIAWRSAVALDMAFQSSPDFIRELAETCAEWPIATSPSEKNRDIKLLAKLGVGRKSGRACLKPTAGRKSTAAHKARELIERILQAQETASCYTAAGLKALSKKNPACATWFKFCEKCRDLPPLADAGARAAWLGIIDVFLADFGMDEETLALGRPKPRKGKQIHGSKVIATDSTPGRYDSEIRRYRANHRAIVCAG